MVREGNGVFISRTAVIACVVLTAGGCSTPWTPRLTLPDRYAIVREQLVVHSGFPLPPHHRLLDELAARRGDLRDLLGLPGSDEPIHIYLFENADRFEAFMRVRHPNFPSRRAYFLETDTHLHVYAQWGDRVAEDLRHEVTHAYVHAVVPNLPLWLDEGLAEYAEAPRGQHGLNRSDLDGLLGRLKRGAWRPNLVRLEGLDPTRDMTEEDYCESWAWVHMLLESGLDQRAMLRQYLADLRRNGAALPISARLARSCDRPGDALVAHVVALSAEAGAEPR